MRCVALVAAHFPPSNLAAVHRARLWAQHLHEFGWRPIIVTTHWRHYEERLDWDLCELLDPDIEIVRTPALPTKPLRVIGDIGIRALPWHRAALLRLIAGRRIDFVHITVPSFYSALLGPSVSRTGKVPFGIDYIDPWVHVWPEAEKVFSKAWISMKLGEQLEPWAVRNASLITGVGESYYAGVIERNPRLRESAVIAAMPYGNSTRDFDVVARKPREPYLFNPTDGGFHLFYAGAMLPRAYAVLDRLLAAVQAMKRADPDAFARLRIHFVGTGRSPDDPAGYQILPIADRFGLRDTISEHPHRIPYVDALSHLRHASGVLVLGSTEPHYSPSKIYQAIASGRPVFALLHEASTAIQVLKTSGAGVAVPLSEASLPEPRILAARLARFIRDPGYSPDRVRWSEFGAYSARESARRLAAALDAASERFARAAASGPKLDLRAVW